MIINNYNNIKLNMDYHKHHSVIPLPSIIVIIIINIINYHYDYDYDYDLTLGYDWIQFKELLYIKIVI